MGATGRVKSNIALAEGALLGGGGCGSGLFLADLHQCVDSLQKNEEDEGGQNEVDDCGEKSGGGGTEGVYPGLPLPGEECGQKRLDEVGGQRGNDGSESTADDDADRHIQYVSAEGEFFEIFEKLFHFCSFLSLDLCHFTTKTTLFQPFLQIL